MGDYLSFALLGTIGLLLVSAGIEDARTREIANWKNAAIALLAPLWWWTNGYTLWPDMAFQFGFALLVFAVFIGAFALGQMGGGDVKLIGALALWLPPMPMLWMLVVMSLLGGVLTVIMLVEKWWRSQQRPIEIPYGVAIAIAALLSLREPIINQLR
ncbi:A24 family peptidase [Sphingomonas sp.]|uniref:A24 family peptidase n=1 Tax=Sphingomonas sp. TaxID=28214 RepID=UPI002C0A1594|nr:prepilin peptidase [Sphingomonas sp.]HWK35854.1 prepilin peptidase [Sphingomonas sp.]